MSAPEFWQTHMGKKFYEATLPELVRQLSRLADVGERTLRLAEAVVGRAGSTGAAAQPAPPADPVSKPSSVG